jgi:hypothetical protein
MTQGRVLRGDRQFVHLVFEFIFIPGTAIIAAATIQIPHPSSLRPHRRAIATTDPCHDERLAQVRHRPRESLDSPPIDGYIAVVVVVIVARWGWDVDAEVGVDQSGTVGVDHQLATELQAGVDAITLVREVTLDDGD